MHVDEVRVTEDQVRRLLSEQMPQWADLELTQLRTEGTDHVLFRLGDDLLVRMPKIGWAVDQAERDARWLSQLAPHLPVPVPAPFAVGEPGAGFPWPWSVVPWIEGDIAGPAERSRCALAHDVAGFARALHRVTSDGGPPKTDRERGAPLPPNDAKAHEALTELAAHDDGFVLDEVAEVWADAVKAPPWDRPPVWIHGDLQPGNLIVRDGRLAAVIDFGGLGLGDPAPDVAAAFWTFRGEARRVYREAIGYDEATWRRARGWALLPSLTGLSYYRHTFPKMMELARGTIDAVLEDMRAHT